MNPNLTSDYKKCIQCSELIAGRQLQLPSCGHFACNSCAPMFASSENRAPAPCPTCKHSPSSGPSQRDEGYMLASGPLLDSALSNTDAAAEADAKAKAKAEADAKLEAEGGPEDFSQLLVEGSEISELIRHVIMKVLPETPREVVSTALGILVGQGVPDVPSSSVKAALRMTITSWSSSQRNLPRGVAVDAMGNIVATDSLNHHVAVLDRNGKAIRVFGSPGTGPGELLCPEGVAVDISTGQMAIADRGNRRVCLWSRDGLFIRSFGTQGQGLASFNSPRCVAIDQRNGNILVGDQETSQVSVWGPQGLHISTFGSGTIRPAGIAVDPRTGNIVIADSMNMCLSIWTEHGVFRESFGSRGNQKGQLDWPIGVAIDSRTNRIIVADRYNHRVQVWTTDGLFITDFGQQDDSNRLASPWGVAVSPSTGDILVADSSNHRIQVWELAHGRGY